MTIRNIRKDDYEAIDTLLLQLHDVDVKGRPELFVKKNQFMPRDAFESLLENEGVRAVAAVKWGRILGCCFSSVLDRSAMVEMRTVYIDLLVVDERYRRRGIGRALFQSVEEYARALGAKRVDLMVWDHNKTAIDAYEAYGMARQRSVYEKHL